MSIIVILAVDALGKALKCFDPHYIPRPAADWPTIRSLTRKKKNLGRRKEIFNTFFKQLEFSLWVGPSQHFEICWPIILSSPQEDKMSCIVKEWSAFVRGNCKKSLEFCQEAGAASLDGSNPLLMVDDPDFPKGRKPLWFPHKELISSIFRTIAPHLTHTSQRRLVAHKSITSDSCKSTICRLNKSWIHGHRQIATIYLRSNK